MQRLRYPYQSWRMIVPYRSPAYLEHWGYSHYGVDITCTDATPLVRASGKGRVIAAGDDGSLGWGVAILYRACEVRGEPEPVDLVARYMHLESVIVESGDVLHAGDAFAREGSRGTQQRHLHVELDRDTRELYACWTPQMSRQGHDFWVKGIDTTLDPERAFWR